MRTAPEPLKSGAEAGWEGTRLRALLIISAARAFTERLPSSQILQRTENLVWNVSSHGGKEILGCWPLVPPLAIGDRSRAHPRCPLRIPGTSLGRSGCATTCRRWGNFSQNWVSSVFLPPAILGGGFGRPGNYSRSCFQAGVDGEQRLRGSAAELRARGKSKT